MGVTTLVSEISFVVDRAKLLNFGHRSRRRVHLLLDKMKVFRPLDHKRLS